MPLASSVASSSGADRQIEGKNLRVASRGGGDYPIIELLFVLKKWFSEA